MMLTKIQLPIVSKCKKLEEGELDAKEDALRIS